MLASMMDRAVEGNRFPSKHIYIHMYAAYMCIYNNVLVERCYQILMCHLGGMYFKKFTYLKIFFLNHTLCHNLVTICNISVSIFMYISYFLVESHKWEWGTWRIPRSRQTESCLFDWWPWNNVVQKHRTSATSVRHNEDSFLFDSMNCNSYFA